MSVLQQTRKTQNKRLDLNTHRRKLLLVVAFALGVGGIFLFGKSNIKALGGLSGIVGIISTAIALLIGLWQIILTQQATGESKEAAIASQISALQKSSDERDRYHEQLLADIKAQIATISTHLEQHQQSLGHDGSIRQILDLTNKISQLEAMVAVQTRQGEFSGKLDRLARRLEQIERSLANL